MAKKPGFAGLVLFLRQSLMNQPIDQLTTWLQQPVYLTGVSLYERLIGPGFLLEMLKAGVDDYNRECLHDALAKHLAELQQAEKAKKESYPETLVAELGSGGLLMDERTILKERMRVLYNSGISEGEELQIMAFRILDIKDNLDGIYGRKHFFEQHGFLPDAAGMLPEEETPASLLKRRNTLRTYVSKYQKAVETAYEPKKLRKAKAKLEAFQAELHEVDNHLLQLNKSTHLV